MWLADTPFIQLLEREEVVEKHRALPHRRRRDAAPVRSSPTPTPSTRSSPRSPRTRITERGATRADDRISEAGMEDRKTRGVLLMELLRFATAGSVDDGKSTLIGRLLYDTKSIFEDQLEAVERASTQMGAEYVEPRAAHRRPAGRARAGHHDRRRLPLLRHAQAQVHHRRHARATSSTRATWSPARRPPTSRSCSSTCATA